MTALTRKFATLCILTKNFIGMLLEKDTQSFTGKPAPHPLAYKHSQKYRMQNGGETRW